MLVGASERELSVSLFDMHLPTPLFMCPIGVIGLCSQDFHGDIQVAKASAQTGVPMVASTLTQDRMEDVAPHAGDTPGLFQLYTPTDKELTASLLHRAEQAGYRGVVITLDTWTLGWPTRTQTNHQVSPGKVTGPMDTVRHCTLRPAVAGIAHVLPTVHLGWWATLTKAASAETAVTHITGDIHQDQRSHNGEALS
jgi:hypothetical protein